jgi:PilZ domain
MPVLKGLEIRSFAGVEARKSDRFPMRSAVNVCCLGSDRVIAAQGLNISDGGMAFVVAEELPYGALIQVALPQSGVSAVARVRNCVPHDAGWRVGVEFLGSLA